MIEDGYTIEEVDAMTGPLIGLPNSASFRLLDIVGLDVWNFVSKNLYELVPNDPWRERFVPPPFLTEMVSRGWLGEKSGKGFSSAWAKVTRRKSTRSTGRRSSTTRAQKVNFPEAEQARMIEDLPARLKALVYGKGRVANFLWKLYSDGFLYSAERIPEISDRIVEMDQAMRWGYAHKLGPFELADALGVEEMARRIEADGRALPPDVVKMLATGAKGFYRPADSSGVPRTDYFCFQKNRYDALEERPGVLSLKDIKRAGGVVKSNAGASLVDLGDGVLCLEFHSKMNSLGEDPIGMIYAGIEETNKNFEAMVIANEGENFSVGANLMLVLLAAQEGEWDELNMAIHRFQQATMAIKYAAKPVVAAPFSRALGGGCEIVLHSRGVQASAELYMGLVEVGVGLIPGAGGCKELIARLKDPRKVFELIGMAKVSTSAEDAKELGLLDERSGYLDEPRSG